MYRFVREPSSFNDNFLECSAMGQENETLFTTASSTEILSWVQQFVELNSILHTLILSPLLAYLPPLTLITKISLNGLYVLPNSTCMELTYFTKTLYVQSLREPFRY